MPSSENENLRLSRDENIAAAKSYQKQRVAV